MLGRNPRTQRDELMRDVCFIADVAVLSRWLKVSQALDYVAGVHPRFNRERAEEFLRKTDLKMNSRVRELSRGMVTQLHLALILAIDARLLVLDEPTLGLDLLYRRQFYDTLLNDYFDKERTILADHAPGGGDRAPAHRRAVPAAMGARALSAPVESLAEQYVQLTVDRRPGGARARVAARSTSGRSSVAWRCSSRARRGRARALGDVRTPSIADLFVAKMQRPHEHQPHDHADPARVLGASRAVDAAAGGGGTAADRRAPIGKQVDSSLVPHAGAVPRVT